MTARQSKVPRKWDLEVDLVAMGASSGGLTAVILGHDLGLSTVLLEKSEYLGGGTALSGGVLWVPCNDHMAAEGLQDSREEALTHIRRTSLGRHEEALLAAYLDTGPEAVRYMETHTPLKLTIEASTDYYADLPGGKKHGRQIYPDPNIMIPLLKEAEAKYPILQKVRPDPVPFFCGQRHKWAEGRGLIGGLVLACAERGINILTGVGGKQLIVQKGKVIGLRAERDGKDFFVKAHRGVLLASGGYERNAAMNKRFLNAPDLHGVTPPSNEGDGHIMGMEVGAAIALMDHSIYQPVIRVEGEEVEGKPLYRLLSYGYPGNILVNRHGRRCCNESFYPDIGRAFVEYDKNYSELANAPLFWIADHAEATRSYMTLLASFTKNPDWLVSADTLPELASKLGIPAAVLVETVDRFNHFAAEGRDPDFHRGESAYNHYWGSRRSPDFAPGPVLGPLETPPFYGVRLELGTVGNLGGLVTNDKAQVVNSQGDVIPGLYGTSNTTALLTHGFTYTSGACQAKSFIFGYLAARHMAQTTSGGRS
jgi:3-oxosteroid 1-dehydrogenase